MELSGEYNYDSQYNPEIFSLCGMAGIFLIGIIGCLIYYYVKFTDKQMHYSRPEVIVNILLASGLMSGFLCIFYFTYLDKVEKEVMINNIKSVFSDIMPANKIPANIAGIINSLLTFLDANNVQDDSVDTDAIANNTKIRTRAIIIFGGGFICVVIIALITIFMNKLDILKIIGINMLLLLSIVIMEFIFATFFVANYDYIDINNVLYDGLAVLQWDNIALTSVVNPSYPTQGYYYYAFYDN